MLKNMMNWLALASPWGLAGGGNVLLSGIFRFHESQAIRFPIGTQLLAATSMTSMFSRRIGWISLHAKIPHVPPHHSWNGTSESCFPSLSRKYLDPSMLPSTKLVRLLTLASFHPDLGRVSRTCSSARPGHGKQILEHHSMLTPDIVHEVSTIPPVMIAMRRAMYVAKEIQSCSTNFVNYSPGSSPASAHALATIGPDRFCIVKATPL